MPNPLVIRLDTHESECIACGAPLSGAQQGLPMRDGEILTADDPGEWGGFDACPECFRAWTEAGPRGVADRLSASKEPDA